MRDPSSNTLVYNYLPKEGGEKKENESTSSLKKKKSVKIPNQLNSKTFKKRKEKKKTHL